MVELLRMMFVTVVGAAVKVFWFLLSVSLLLGWSGRGDLQSD
jgi:hypothetical protein